MDEVGYCLDQSHDRFLGRHELFNSVPDCFAAAFILLEPFQPQLDEVIFRYWKVAIVMRLELYLGKDDFPEIDA